MKGNLVLGTANFGTKYGISNGELVLQENEIKKIVRLAENSGLFHFDTAPTYGNAESQLGLWLEEPKKTKIFTKISTENSISVSSIMESAIKSRDQTGVSKFAGIYLHDENILESIHSRELLAGIKELLDSGITERVGVSVYSIDALLKAKDICSDLNLFQVPENICDRRIYKSKDLNELAHNGVSIYVRSIFLQGLLLMEPMDLPQKFSRVIPDLEKLIAYVNSLEITREALCISYARMIPWASGIVVGVASLSHLQDLLKPTISLPEDFELHVPILDFEFLDPRGWPKLL